MPVISRRFADELAEKEMRDAYLDAQTRTKLAQQIRALRAQREWSQRDLGDRMGKPQSNVARLEDRDVARYTLTTLLELGSAFDVALVAKFVTYEEFLRDTENLSPERLIVRSFDRAALSPLCEDEQGQGRLANWKNVADWVRLARPHPSLLPENILVKAADPGRSWRLITSLFPKTLLTLGEGANLAEGWQTALADNGVFGTGTGISVQVKLPPQDQEIARLRAVLAEKEARLAAAEREITALKAKNAVLRAQFGLGDSAPAIPDAFIIDASQQRVGAPT